jgi:hypothetical protein
LALSACVFTFASTRTTTTALSAAAALLPAAPWLWATDVTKLRGAWIAMTWRLFAARRRRGCVVEALCTFPHEAAADEFFQRSEGRKILGRDEADGIADGLRTACAANAVDVVFGVHGEVVVHDVGDAIHIDASRGDVRGDEHPHST